MSEEQKRLIEETVENLKHLDKESLLVVKGSVEVLKARDAMEKDGSYKTGIVMGGCHSIAFTILQACDKRIMGQGTTAIIHDMWETVTGNAADLRAEADNIWRHCRFC